LVVTPSRMPRSAAWRISSRRAVSRKIFMNSSSVGESVSVSVENLLRMFAIEGLIG
jgi:hypothetical protein